MSRSRCFIGVSIFVLLLLNTGLLLFTLFPSTQAMIKMVTSIIAEIVAILAFAFGVYTYKRNKQTERVRKTVEDFPITREKLGNLSKRLKNCSCTCRRQIMRAYAMKMDQFAVAVNCGAYDLNIVNQMSGGVLIQHYEQHMALYIAKVRRRNSGKYVNTPALYANYETMILRLYKLRGIKKEIDET